MERASFVVNGGIKLPIGYRFHPTDEELVVHYLKRKAFGLPLPAFVIPEFDVFKSHPLSLPGDLKEKNRYFFGKKSKGNDNENKCKRPAGSGYWKPIGKNRQIVASGINQTVGIKRTLSFYEVKKPNSHGTKTQWIMHEYCLVGFATTQISKNNEREDWVVYCVSHRKRKPKKHGVISPKPCNYSRKNQAMELVSPNSIDFMVQDSSDFGPPQPSSPSSSGVAEDFSNGTLDQEESSGYISFRSK